MVQPWDWDDLPRQKQLDLMAWYEVNQAEEAQARREMEKANVTNNSKVRSRRKR